jgi:hypothetical protein
MKHISAYFDKKESATEKFAWWPVRRSFGKKNLIWLKKYVELEVFYDDMGLPPKKNLSWKLIYTPGEYLIYTLKKDETKVY